jgi:choline monooxygenase
MKNSPLHEFVTPSQIDALRKPIKEARGLPRPVYVDEAFYRYELGALFPKQWMGVAYAGSIAEPGDATPVTVAGLPLMLVRGEDGEVRAFHNVCRHRGTIVLQEPVRHARTLRCSYHSWTWDLEGQLRSRPLWDGREDAKEDCLVVVRCAVWCGIIFVTLSDETAPLEEHFSFLWDRWKLFDFEALAPFAIRDWQVKTNWKLHALGVLEPYHEPFIHPQIINSVTDPVTGEKKMDNDTFANHLEGTCIGISTPGTDRDYNWSGNFPRLPGLPDDVEYGQDIFLLFPNVTVAIAPNHVLTMICSPEAVDRSNVSVALFVAHKAVTDPALAEDRDSLLSDWTQVTEQDVAVLELQQAGHASPVSDQAKFSPYWESTAHYFEMRVIEELE